MSLNPSNGIAQRENPNRHVFPNLARHVLPAEDAASLSDFERQAAAVDRQRIFDEVDAACRAELEAAGIKPGGFECFRETSGGRFKKVPTKLIGELCMWGFRRAWYYWIAQGPGIPADIAEEFHKTWGTQCRVNGHCCCPSPLEKNR